MSRLHAASGVSTMGDGNESDDDGLVQDSAPLTRGASYFVLLPPHLKDVIVSTEADRFAAAVDALTSEWEWTGTAGAAPPPLTHKLQNSLRWVSLISRRARVTTATAVGAT